MTWEATCLPNHLHTKGGFETEEEAKAYAEKFFCKPCWDSLDLPDDDEWKITDIWDSPCACEWMVEEE